MYITVSTFTTARSSVAGLTSGVDMTVVVLLYYDRQPSRRSFGIKIELEVGHRTVGVIRTHVWTGCGDWRPFPDSNREQDKQ